jgi:hypothetical protein
MKNKFIKPEIEILTFHCSVESFDADSFTQDAKLGSGYGNNRKYALPNGAQPEQGGVNVPGGDLGVPY